MNEINHTPDQSSRNFEAGMLDGYRGFHPRLPEDVTYMDGYAVGDKQFMDDQEASRYDDEASDAAYFSEVEQGMYDDDPSPYAGDYSEM